MKKFDILWLLGLLLVAFILLYPTTHNVFVSATNSHPYIMGFIKVAILATMGELLALRIATGKFTKPHGLIYRLIVWGFLGMCFVIVFDLFANGVKGAMGKGLLPALSNNPLGSKILFAFFTSTFMNLIFAPTFMALHRVTDTYIDLGKGSLEKILKVKLDDVINNIDWNGFISFVVLKTIPFFWIPAHTVTFMLPSVYRVLVAAFLSIALGAILAFAKRNKAKA
ncbi:hypothetical protein [Thermohalobacter berrensis]|uniref:Mpv17/PMP22 n=1 Tax=Thermohalobacter berrensis TaxID=99594 RepID=A0A419TA90_9FIRM|nr:hypothetical protein [Thermohalobacter berrensis]RKD34390.1 hypothetical protein BET03_00730 [Thermohalobacter berrensis]